MGTYKQSTKKADINIRLSEFEMPPMQDVLIVGKRAPLDQKLQEEWQIYYHQSNMKL